MATTVLDVLKKKIEDDMSSAQEFLSSGGAKDFSQYKEIVGLVRGLETCTSYITDLSRNYLDDNND
tara:strand:- start:56 stop:253 length:198 start_codon:yes stop_codon:yes gene_type:complete